VQIVGFIICISKEQICVFCWFGMAAAMFATGKLFALRISSSESYVLLPFEPSLDFDVRPEVRPSRENIHTHVLLHGMSSVLQS
jgi:hypothetical protein